MPEQEMVAEFQCPGCVAGSDTDCGRYEYDIAQLRCVSHVCGTFVVPGGTIALGMPKGFNKCGHTVGGEQVSQMNIRLFPIDSIPPEWDLFNVAVWAMEHDGYLFVRTFAPRINATWVDVIEGGTLEMVPNAINAGGFFDDFD